MPNLPESKDVEWMLKNYESNRKRITERKNEILALNHQSCFEGHASNTGRHGSPVESMVIRFESDRELRFLKSQVLPVEYFLQTSATGIDKQLLQLRYFHQGKRRTWEEIAALMGFSAIYVRSKCRTGLLQRAAAAFRKWEDKNTK